jgi:hypothetical protein
MSSRPTPAIIGIVVAVVVALALGGWWVAADDDADPAAGPTPSASPSTVGSTDDASESTAKTRAPKTVSPRPVAKAKRRLTDPVPLAAGATAEVTRIEAVRSRAEIPGEISAPALRFTVRATAGDSRLDLTPIVVNAYYGDGRTPAISMGSPGAEPFSGRLPAGKSATGVFVFNVPVAERGRVHLEFSWSPQQKPVILTGDVS